MTIYEYGNPDADTVLIQLTGDHELSVLKNEVEEIRKRTSTDFRLIAAKVDEWNYELSPWKAPAVFGNEDFGDGAVRTLEQILTLCTDKSRTYYIGGYSLAGLFSLWAAYQTCPKELLRTTNWHQLWKLPTNGSEVTPVLKRVILQSEKTRPTWLQK